MPEAAAGEVIVLHLDHELRRQGLPLCRTFRAPPARPARCLAREPRLPDQLLELRRQLLTLRCLHVRAEPDMVEQTIIIIEAEQKRANDFRVARVPEAADDA